VILKKKYKDLNETLHYLKLQVIESVPFACAVIPKNVRTPEQLYNWLLPYLKYKNDPKSSELLQTFQTMMCGKFWGKPGAGDCDCFTIATLASAVCLGWKNVYIALVGRQRSHPVHIYTVVYQNGKRVVLDFTNKKFDKERDTYNYIQEIPVPWQKWNFN